MMTLTVEQTETATRYLAKQKYLLNLKNAVIYIRPVLQATLEADIIGIKNQIKTWRQTHPNATRTEYIAAIQPLKDQLRAKVIQNNDIIASNSILIQQAQADYTAAILPKQTNIDTLENTIKTYLESINLNP